MKRISDYEDHELRRAFSSLSRLKSSERAVGELSRRLEKEPGIKFRKVPFNRIRREVLVAVFTTLLIAVPLTFFFTNKYTKLEPPPKSYIVRFVYENEEAKSVVLLGDFNNWQKDEIVMQRVEGSDVWVAEVRLTEGLYKYGFLVDEINIVSDPFSRFNVKDGFGNESSFIVLTSTEEEGGPS
ncbi:MAG: glycogen-binding domain-containing protein [Spirochaetota bacterium]|nr:MAG: glycogen-binding domain-containing protein [Spirochaetota bacterium]